MKEFETYYKKRMAEIRKLAKKENMSAVEYLKDRNRKTPEEYKEYLRHRYEFKSCHSFWHSECTNRGIECGRCKYFFSQSDWDKMTVKERNRIKK